ncbi:hypothetical protein GE09DRAFT_1121465 [Coniochaeta sp. 2T2.1]|nr:hypothetical protein GE09DRAFT_1121465 [Coniochaeta sp. 2T2.1]
MGYCRAVATLWISTVGLWRLPVVRRGLSKGRRLVNTASKQVVGRRDRSRVRGVRHMIELAGGGWIGALGMERTGRSCLTLPGNAVGVTALDQDHI